jgi:hypothetical protein
MEVPHSSSATAVEPPSDHTDKDGELNTASGFADTSISVYCPDGYINTS